MVGYKYFKNNKHSQQKQQQGNVMIDTIFMLNCINFFFKFMLFILWLTIYFNILLLLSALNLPTFILIVFLGEFIQILNFSI